MPIELKVTHNGLPGRTDTPDLDVESSYYYWLHLIDSQVRWPLAYTIGHYVAPSARNMLLRADYKRRRAQGESDEDGDSTPDPQMVSLNESHWFAGIHLGGRIYSTWYDGSGPWGRGSSDEEDIHFSIEYHAYFEGGVSGDPPSDNVIAGVGIHLWSGF